MQINRWLMNGTDGAAWIVNPSARDITTESATITGVLETHKGDNYSLAVFCAEEDYSDDSGAWQGGHSATDGLSAPVPDGAFNFTLQGLTANTPYMAHASLPP